MLWKPAFFGVKPDCIIKGGTIVAAPMGDPNASIPTPQPVHYRPMFGAFGRARTASSVVFASKAAVKAGLGTKLGIQKKLVAVENTRGKISKKNMIHNDATPDDRGRSGDLRSARRRRAPDLRAGGSAADGATLLPVLSQAHDAALTARTSSSLPELVEARGADRVVLDADERHRRRIG